MFSAHNARKLDIEPKNLGSISNLLLHFIYFLCTIGIQFFMPMVYKIYHDQIPVLPKVLNCNIKIKNCSAKSAGLIRYKVPPKVSTATLELFLDLFIQSSSKSVNGDTGTIYLFIYTKFLQKCQRRHWNYLFIYTNNL